MERHIRCSVFIATSVDGYIARSDGNIDWLHKPEYAIEGEDFGYQAFMESVDVLIMGRNTLQTVQGFGFWPYEGKRVVVLSRSLQQVPGELTGKIELYAGELLALLQQLAEDGCRHAYIDGGRTIQSFIQQGLIDNLTITRIPILLGEGIPLFTQGHDTFALNLTASQSYANGFVSSSYEVITSLPA